MYVPVDIYLKTPAGDPVEGVMVRVFNASGTTTFTQQLTDNEGKVSLLLFTQQYSMRFYKFHTTFSQPQLFEVLDEPASNVFDVVARPFELPIANDPRLCRCSGYFRDIDGSPQEYLDLHFTSEFNPVLLEDAAVIPREVLIRTDEKGYAQIDLIRGGRYKVTIEGMEAGERCVRVPDLPSTNLPFMLFPIVKRVVFSPSEPYAVPLGGTLVLTPTVYDSAGVPLIGTATSDVDWTLSDPNIASLAVGETTLTLTGLLAGTVELRASRRDLSIIAIPALPIVGVPLSLPVS